MMAYAATSTPKSSRRIVEVGGFLGVAVSDSAVGTGDPRHRAAGLRFGIFASVRRESRSPVVDMPCHLPLLTGVAVLGVG